MLALTDTAVGAVKAIVASSEGLPPTAGVRMSVADREGTQANLRLSVAEAPGEDETVIEENGARVFLDHAASGLLEDMTLDASIEEHQVQFSLGQQPG